MNNGRWWEFYFVRYAMGTLVGAAIVNQLMRVDHRLRDMLIWGIKDSDGSTMLLLLASYGLVFCYIASIPVLILHVARSLLPTSSPHRQGKIAKHLEATLPLAIPIVLWLVLVAVLLLPLNLLKEPNLDSRIGHITLLIMFFCLGLPATLVTLAIMMWRRSYSFYKKLAHARSIQANNGELVTSYRHLREHGNSIFIVLLECVLGLSLFAAYRMSLSIAHSSLILPPQFYLYGLVVFIWTLPGALVWVFATLLENEFVRDQNWLR